MTYGAARLHCTECRVGLCVRYVVAFATFSRPDALQLTVLYLPAKTRLCMAPQLTTNRFDFYQANVKRHGRLIRR